MPQPDGTPTKITFLTVGGRTSAVIEAVQKLPAGLKQQAKSATKAKAKGRKPPKRTRGDSSDEEDEAVKAEEAEDADLAQDVKAEGETEDKPVVRKPKTAPAPKAKRARMASPPVKDENIKPEEDESSRRRSSRRR